MMPAFPRLLHKTRSVIECAMTLTLNIPNDLSEDLNAKFDDLGRTAMEALAAEAYEQDVVSGAGPAVAGIGIPLGCAGGAVTP